MHFDTIKDALKLDPAVRDTRWEKHFLRLLPDQKFKIIREKVQEGPDGWPYLWVGLTDDPEGETLDELVQWLSTRGVGLVLNPEKSYPDYVFTYGMIWNYRERREFLSEASASAKPDEVSAAEQGDFKLGEKLFVGPPTASYLPDDVRGVLRQFLIDQGVLRPRILLVSRDEKNFDLAFSIESMGNPPESEWQGLCEALAWFMPLHYPVAVLSEKAVPGFVDL